MKLGVVMAVLVRQEGEYMKIRCRNCIHNGVCYMQEVCNDIEKQLDEFGCENYKDSSAYFLPKVGIGNTVYYFNFIHEEIIPVIVVGYDVYEGYQTAYHLETKSFVPASFRENEIGKSFFLTKEEAEEEMRKVIGDSKRKQRRCCLVKG